MSDSPYKENHVPNDTSAMETPDHSIASKAEQEHNKQHEREKQSQHWDAIATALATENIPITTWFSSLPPISQTLYAKAAQQNDTLTPLERLYLLSRLDLRGKALYDPDDLTTDEINQLLLRPPRIILDKNIRRFFCPKSPPSEQPDSDGKHEEEITTIPDVVKTHYPAIMSCNPKEWQKCGLSYDALECISLSWWTTYQERGPMLYDPATDEGHAVNAAAALLGQRTPLEELEFEQKATELWCGGGSSVYAANSEPENEAEEEREFDKWYQARLDTAVKLRGELLIRVREKLDGLSDGERKELVEIKERERVEVEKERDLERLEKLKRKMEREEENKRAKERRKRRWAGKKIPTVEGDDGGHVGGSEEDDEDGGYEYGFLRFDDE
ncbi:hypothetical protein QBC37DRAFT_482772 [Rhypophila decipiens]|uniref:Uncharacterized protein n=1 Tax=Rhypophila decipiens TaxID=261697 RepID=A0AAN6Y7F2_9PEZI|nr:hypothetical protein QBC37DRAFT_482772 [Rhypophila decipiens]